MNTGEWLHLNEAALQNAGVGSARLDAMVLLSDVLSKDKAWLLAHPKFELDTKTLELLDWQIKRRAGHEPLAYIRGRSEFYGRDFYLDKRVLVPRPESETMIDLLKSLELPNTTRLADVGTGSGALGLTAILELNLEARNCFLIDLDPDCLVVAKINAKKHQRGPKIIKSDLLAEVNEPIDIILANLPYVPDSHTINQAAMQEPKIAIFGGADGLDVYSQLFKQLAARQQKVKYVLIESLPPQHADLAKIAHSSGYGLTKTGDFIQLFLAS